MFGPAIRLVFAALAVSVLATSVQAAEPPFPGNGPVLRKKPNPELPPAGAGCDWLGKRVLMSLVREDIVAANDLLTVYERFACEPVPLRHAFDCVSAQPLPEGADRVTQLIGACWADPAHAAVRLELEDAPAGSEPAPAKPVK